MFRICPFASNERNGFSVYQGERRHKMHTESAVRMQKDLHLVILFWLPVYIDLSDSDASEIFCHQDRDILL